MGDEDIRSYSDDRRRLLAELELERKQLLRNIDYCRIRDIDRPFIGEWSLKDIVGHVASWEAEAITALREIRAGRHVHLLDFDRGDVDAWNQDHVERKRHVDFFSLLAQLKDGRQRLLDELAAVSDEELSAEGSLYARLIHAAIAHDRDHWHEIAAKLAGATGVRREAPVISLPEEIARQI
jgi:hypothetical protein